MSEPLAGMLVGEDGTVPKERYTSREFLEAEMACLWSRVWQVACREEEVPSVGDYLEYLIGDQSVLVVRAGPDELKAFHNCCLHRGTRLAEGTGSFSDGQIRCRYHAWCYHLDGRLKEVVDREEFGPMPEGLGLKELRCESWGGFVFVSMDPAAPPLADYLQPIPDHLGPYHLERMRFVSYKTTVLPANWKVVVDAFNEAYHVQGTHPQLLAWTDDVNMEYQQVGIHSRYGRLENSRRQLRPSPRLQIPDDEVDEWEILSRLVSGLGGLFLREERRLVEQLRAQGVPEGASLLQAYQQARRQLLASRGLDVSGLSLDQMTSADDFYWFPNLVGPIYPGTAILFRVRPNGTDPDSAVQDLWTLQWPDPGAETRPLRREYYPDWAAKDWGLITNQDFANMAHVQQGMKSRGCGRLRLNPRQESNILHMHRVIDRYLRMGPL
jgi:nitrite reductase/ring-hydroxylating ferredoxin subunit